MSARLNQRGFMLIAAIFLIVVAAVFGSVIAFRVVGGSQSGADAMTRAQALYIAHTGIERWLRQRALSNAFAGEGPTAFGNGTFTTTSNAVTDCDGNALAANWLRVNSVASIASTSASASLCVVIDLLRVGGAMMVYAKESPAGSVGVPFYRRWSSVTDSWGAEATAIDVGPNIHYMVLKFAHTRNEAILGTVNSNGEIHVQVWNGTAWGNLLLLATVGGGGEAEYRGFDVEYETAGDRAIVVYNDNSADPNYRIWDGTAWSVETDINIPTTGEVRWVELAPHPFSSEIVMITLDDNFDVKGMRWPGGGTAGTAWSDMGVAGVWDTSAANSGNPAMNPSKVIDVAYEQLSGRAMFIWGDAVATDNYYRIWNGVALSVANILLDIPAMSDDADWVRLVSRPNSNELMYAVQDGARDLQTRRWLGPPAADPSWDGDPPHAQHDGSTEDVDQRNFDIVYETHPANAGQAWLVWGEGGVLGRKRWNGATWDAVTTVGDDTGLVQLVAHPSSGALFAGIYEDSGSASDDISEMHQVNGVQTWSGYVDIWTGPIAGDPAMERVFIASERFTPVVSWREELP